MGFLCGVPRVTHVEPFHPSRACVILPPYEQRREWSFERSANVGDGGFSWVASDSPWS